MSHGSWRGLPLGGRADAEIAPGVGAWCEPARTADPLGLGADERWFGSRKQVILASIVSNARDRHAVDHVVQVCPNPPGHAGKPQAPPTFD